ncbi:TetR/AcrR family transcriptional regulator [soil metagenome]
MAVADSARICAETAGAKPQALRILTAARRCFERYGFHAASMAQIAGAAGMSVGHIYRYFANKEAVIAAIVEQDLDEIIADIETLSGTPDEIARRILAHVERSRSRQRTALWLEVMAEAARNPKIAPLITAFDRRIRARLHEAISQGCVDQCGNDTMTSEEIETRMSLIGVLMDGLQVRTFLEGEALPEGVQKHIRALLAQTLSPAPIITDAA